MGRLIGWPNGAVIAWPSVTKIAWGSTPPPPPGPPSYDFSARMAALIPNGWVSQAARIAGSGILWGLLESWETGMQTILAGINYARGSTRIPTAVAPELDLASEDFFGDALPRLAGESDQAFAARIEANLLPLGATRAAVIAAVKKVTGAVPRVIEPWRPLDTGVWDGPPEFMMYWDVDTVGNPFRWTDPGLEYQGFVETISLTLPVLNGNPLNCFDDGFYWDTPGSSWFDFSGQSNSAPNRIFSAINAVKVFGTVVWVRFIGTRPIVDQVWDGFGMFWDLPPYTWDPD